LLILASGNEIAGSKGSLPSYFTQSRAWGSYRVDVEPRVDSRNVDELTLNAYKLTITGPKGQTTQVTVHHVENWPDRQTVREETLVRLAFDLRNRVKDFSQLGVHCKAGLGRTGTFQAAVGFIQDPSLRPLDVLEAGRKTRGPDWVQTEDQLETVVASHRLVRALENLRKPQQVAAPDWPRQSLVDPDAPWDGEPVYENVTPRPAAVGPSVGEPVYENVTPRGPVVGPSVDEPIYENVQFTRADSPPPLPRKQRQSPGAHGVDGPPTPAARPQLRDAGVDDRPRTAPKPQLRAQADDRPKPAPKPHVRADADDRPRTAPKPTPRVTVAR
jgi:hypothetical protein